MDSEFDIEFRKPHSLQGKAKQDRQVAGYIVGPNDYVLAEHGFGVVPIWVCGVEGICTRPGNVIELLLRFLESPQT